MATHIHTELSERIGPMMVKELRQSLRRTSFVLPFIGIHLFATIAIFAEFNLSNFASHSQAIVFRWNTAEVGPFWWVAMGVCGIIMPMAGFFLMPQEIEEGNHELLLLTKLDRWQIILGKFSMLWGLSFLTFTSLIPYLVIRYFIGGIEWASELAHCGTVLFIAAILSAGAIAASGFHKIPAKVGVFVLFLYSAASAGGLSLIGGGMLFGMSRNQKWEILGNLAYHLSALNVVVCYSIIGLLVARSRLRVAFMSFELKPSFVLLILLGIAPFFVGMVAVFTCGFGSAPGLIMLTLLAWRSDNNPRIPLATPPPLPQVPTPQS